MTRPSYGTTCLLIAICMVFVLELGAGLAGDELMLLLYGGLPANGQLHGQYWRLLSYAFLHATPWHLAINGILLLLAGPVVERRFGTHGLLGLFAMTTVLGGATFVAIGLQWPTLGTHVGATSGAVGMLCAALYVRLCLPAVARNTATAP